MAVLVHKGLKIQGKMKSPNRHHPGSSSIVHICKTETGAQQNDSQLFKKEKLQN